MYIQYNEWKKQEKPQSKLTLPVTSAELAAVVCEGIVYMCFCAANEKQSRKPFPQETKVKNNYA